MLKFITGLLGAGGIAGLLPFAPWIIAAVVALAGGGAYLWQSHQVDVAHEQTAEVTKERDAAFVKIGTLQGALDSDEATIKAQAANEAANDDLIATLQHQTDEDAKASIDAGAQIRNLQNADQDVDAYLRGAIPCSLRAILNGTSGPAATACGANANGDAAAAKAKPVPAAK